MANIVIGPPSVSSKSQMWNSSIGLPESFNFPDGKTWEGRNHPLNASRGFRRSIWSQGVSSQHALYWDSPMGGAIDFVGIARADLIDAQLPGVSWNLNLGKSNGGAYSNFYTKAITFMSLEGPDSTDVFEEITSETLEPLNTFDVRAMFDNQVGAIAVSKLYLGQVWDPGVEPDYDIELIRSDASFVSSSGARSFSRTRRPLYKIRMKWEGVSDALTSRFMLEIGGMAHSFGVFLFARNSTHPLGGNKVLFCRLSSIPSYRAEEKIPDYNTIQAEFLEDIS